MCETSPSPHEPIFLLLVWPKLTLPHQVVKLVKTYWRLHSWHAFSTFSYFVHCESNYILKWVVLLWLGWYVKWISAFLGFFYFVFLIPQSLCPPLPTPKFSRSFFILVQCSFQPSDPYSEGRLILKPWEGRILTHVMCMILMFI